MTTYDFAPLFRSTVGFDRLLNTLGHDLRPDWPPYNIEKTGETTYRISMAVAGFAPDELELITLEGALTVTGKKQGTEPNPAQILHRGIANRSFKQSFDLADHLKVVGASLVNGLLMIDLVREVPEAKKPRKIEIGTAQPVGAGSTTIEHQKAA